jgi:hypothetical protein
MEGLFLLALAASEAVWEAGVGKFPAPPMVVSFRALFPAFAETFIPTCNNSKVECRGVGGCGHGGPPSSALFE